VRARPVPRLAPVRLLILSDANTLTTGRLIRAALALAARRPGTEVCAIVTARPEEFRLPRRVAARRLARAALVAAANRGTSLAAEAPGRIDLGRLAARHRVPVIAVPEGGVKATSFSISAGEARSEFTFHRMTAGVDEGLILVEGSLPVDPGVSLRSVMHATAHAAPAALPLLLDRVAAGEPGTPQSGPAGYFSRADAEAIMAVPRPQELTADELRRRARAFGTVKVTIAGAPVPVTRFGPATPECPLAIRTRDGAVLEPDRIAGLPAWLCRGR